MYALLTDSVICNIRYRGSEVIQKLDLSMYDHVRALLPRAAIIRVLVYNAISFKYRWVKLLGVDSVESNAAYKVTTSLRGFSFEAPTGTWLTRFVTLPAGFFKKRKVTEKDIILATLILPTMKNAQTSIKYDENRPYRKLKVKNLLETKSKTARIKCVVDDLEFKIYDLDFNEENFLNDHNDTFYWEYTYRLLRSGYLIPFMFSSNEDFVNESICVRRRDLYWMFQLKYARLNDVYFSQKAPGYEHVSVTKIDKVKVHKRYIRRDLVDLKFNSIHSMPVLIQNNIAIRHVRKR